MGIPSFLAAFYRSPELIEDMIEHWEYFTIEAIRNSVETLKDRIDLVFWWEDLAEKNGPLHLPKTLQRISAPTLQERYRLPEQERDPQNSYGQ